MSQLLGRFVEHITKTAISLCLGTTKNPQNISLGDVKLWNITGHRNHHPPSPGRICVTHHHHPSSSPRKMGITMKKSPSPKGGWQRVNLKNHAPVYENEYLMYYIYILYVYIIHTYKLYINNIVFFYWHLCVYTQYIRIYNVCISYTYFHVAKPIFRPSSYGSPKRERWTRIPCSWDHLGPWGMVIGGGGRS